AVRGDGRHRVGRRGDGDAPDQPGGSPLGRGSVPEAGLPRRAGRSGRGRWVAGRRRRRFGDVLQRRPSERWGRLPRAGRPARAQGDDVSGKMLQLDESGRDGGASMTFEGSGGEVSAAFPAASGCTISDATTLPGRVFGRAAPEGAPAGRGWRFVLMAKRMV